MYGPGDVISVIEAFELSLLSSDWVNEIWQEKFTTCPDDLPDEYSEKFLLLDATETIEVMKQGQKFIKKWLESNPGSRAAGSSANISWTALQDIQHKHLLALIYFYVKKCNSNFTNLTLVELGINASQFYFCLLSIPGSSVYSIFQTSLYESCLEVFNVCKCLNKINGSSEGKSQKSRKSIDGEEEEYTEELTIPQQRRVLKLLNELLVSFQHFVHSFSFKNQIEALKITLMTLADLTRTERQASLDLFTKGNDRDSFALLAKNAYLIMKDFCTELHGRIPELCRLVLFRVMPNLSLIGGSSIPEMAKYTGREQTVVRNIALWFIKNCILPLGTDALQGLKILIQQLCRQMTDRADYRSKATDMVIAIISLLPEESYFAVLKWIFREAMTECATSRVVAVELISKLIYLKQGSPERSNMVDSGNSNVSESSRSHLESLHCQSQGDSSNSQRINQCDGDPTGVSETSIGQARVVSFCKPVEYLPIEFRRMMLAILIDRIRDGAPTVRSKALSTLADIVSNRSSPTVQALVRDVFVTPYLDHSEIDFSTQERGFTKWTTFVAALEKVHDPLTSKSLLPGSIKIVEMVLRKCLEERVNVRRAALSLLVQIFKLNSLWMTKTNLKLYGQHCRDPAMMIRKEMVGAVTDLMLHFPSHQQLTQLWVEEVVPQVADREIRVQEHALTVLTKTILANIKPLEKTRSSMDQLPWHLLTYIATLKMRSFLTTACRLWRDARTPELNPSRITAILSHIGSAQNAPAWVMLSSLSQFVDIANPQPIMDYCLNVIVTNECDIGIANLVLTTLNNSWPKLTDSSQIHLQKELFKSLKNVSFSPNLVPMLVNTVTAMMVTLSSDKPQGLKEVAKWAVETVQECEKHLEPCLSTINADLGNCDACVFYLILLGSLAEMHPEQISRSTYEYIFNFLMSAKSVGHTGLNKLKAVSVLTLARIALGDKYIASRLVSGLSTLISSKYTDPILLINVVVAIADVGERFPNLIEPLVSAMSLCLKNRNREVREMTLIITIDLLQEDYLRARGALIYHLLSLINDPSARTTSIVKFYFTNCMLPKRVQDVDQIILTAMFHYNKYDSHPMYKKLEMTESEEVAFQMSGPKMHHKRMAVYRFLLASLANPMRLRCFHHISHSILNGVGDNIINVETLPGEELLLDAFAVLMSKEIKLDNIGGKKKGDGDEDEEVDEAPRSIDKEVLANVQKADIIDTIVPICIKLRKTLATNRKLTKRLYIFVRELVRDYKSEIDQIFREDKQFGKEILHEINNAARRQDEEMSIEETLSEPNAEVVRAEVADAIENVGRGPKRKSDECQTDNAPKKRKSGEALEKDGSSEEGSQPENDLRMLIEEIGGGHEESMVAQARQAKLGDQSMMLKELRVVIGNIDMLNAEGALQKSQKDTETSAEDADKDSMDIEQPESAINSREDNCFDSALSKKQNPKAVKPSRNTIEKSTSSKEPAVKIKRERRDKGSSSLQDKITKPNEGGKVIEKRGRKTAENFDDIQMSDSIGSLPMLPPSRSVRHLRNNLATPTISHRKPPLFSSTPLISNQLGFDATDISPVVQDSRNEETS